MDLDLINYMSQSDKLQMARKLLQSAKVYNECLFLMTGKRITSDEVESRPNAQKMKERYQYDENHDYAQVLKDADQHPDRLRNYRELMAHELKKMHHLLRDSHVRMILIKDIMVEEGFNLKDDFKVCNRNVASRLETNGAAKLAKSLVARIYQGWARLNGNAH